MIRCVEITIHYAYPDLTTLICSNWIKYSIDNMCLLRRGVGYSLIHFTGVSGILKYCCAAGLQACDPDFTSYALIL